MGRRIVEIILVVVVDFVVDVVVNEKEGECASM